MVKKDNDRLRSQLLELKVRRKEREKQEREITEPPKRELKKDHRLIPGGDTNTVPTKSLETACHFPITLQHHVLSN